MRDPRLFLCILSAFGLAACAQPEAPAGPSLKSEIAAVSASYEIKADGSDPVYSGTNQVFDLVHAREQEAALSELVDCLDDPAPSQTLYAGQAVPTGVVCYQGISVLAYHEPVDASGDIAATWDGWIKPTASQAELEAAERAWRAVLAAKSYSYL